MINQDALGYCEELDVSNPLCLASRHHVTIPLWYIKYIVLRISRPNIEQQPFLSISRSTTLANATVVFTRLGFPLL